jgi:hypothetical protein
MENLEITDFKLSYDGMYFIEWKDEKIPIFLKLINILKMLEIEGLTLSDVEELMELNSTSIQFEKVIMILHGVRKNGKPRLSNALRAVFYRNMLGIIMCDIEIKEI